MSVVAAPAETEFEQQLIAFVGRKILITARQPKPVEAPGESNKNDYFLADFQVEVLKPGLIWFPDENDALRQKCIYCQGLDATKTIYAIAVTSIDSYDDELPNQQPIEVAQTGLGRYGA